LEGKPLETTIHRKTKLEAVRAVCDLVRRGYTLTYPLTEIKSTGTSIGGYNYTKGKFTSIEAMASSVWCAKLKKDIKEDDI
jgi:hypothetical protein